MERPGFNRRISQVSTNWRVDAGAWHIAEEVTNVFEQTDTVGGIAAYTAEALLYEIYNSQTK